MNKVTHFHLPVDNVERAKEFYQKIFDWQITDYGFDRDYQIISTVPVDEHKFKKIESMGGTVIRPKEVVMDMGSFAEITDTEGNLIGLWEI